MLGRVLAIYIAFDKGAPMREVEHTLAIPGAGLEGDRYAYGRGAFSLAARKAIRHVTLFSREDLEAANAILADFGYQEFAPQETRRNIFVEGVSLNDLVGKEFELGHAVFRGFELCDPCARPSRLAGKPGFAEAFAGRGGLRAEIVEGGVVGKDSVFIW